MGRMLDLPHERRSRSLAALEKSGSMGAIVVRECEYPRLPRLRNYFDGNALPGRRALILPSSGEPMHRAVSSAAAAWEGAFLGLAGGQDMANLICVTFDPVAPRAPDDTVGACIAYSLELAARSDLGHAWWMRDEFQDAVLDLVAVGGDRHGETTQVTGGVADVLARVQAGFLFVVVGRGDLAELSRDSCVALLSKFVSAGGSKAEIAARIAQVEATEEATLRRFLQPFILA